MYSGKTVQRINNKNTLNNLPHPSFLTIHLGDHGTVNVLISLIVISQLLIKLLHLCLEGLLHGLLHESVYHLILREIVIHSNGSVTP